MRNILIVLLLLFVPLACSHDNDNLIRVKASDSVKETTYDRLESSYDNNNLINIKASNNVKETTDRLESFLTEKGLTIFARINHAEGAKQIGTDLRPTELLIFGNPKAGTPLMQCQQTIGIDLPLKILIWQDENGQVWLTYNNPEYLASRHGLAGCADKFIKTIGDKLSKIAQTVAKPITKP